MADTVAPDVRSRMMAGIRNKDTKPEMAIRKGLHGLGFRFLLHDKRFPGKPDLVFPKWRAAIFVNGCFWHGHDCHLFKWPASQEQFWRDKITRNQENDTRAFAALRGAGWRVALVWECALKGKTRLNEPEILRKLTNWLRSGSETMTIRGS